MDRSTNSNRPVMSESERDALDLLAERDVSQMGGSQNDAQKPSQGTSTRSGQLHVAAVATHLERYMPLLVQSSAKLGINLEVLGWGEKLTGFAFRLQKTLDYVETLPPDDVVLFIDAFDVVLLQNAQVILKKFYASGAQMIVSKDGDHPNGVIDFFIKRVFRPVGNTYINIGGYIGYAGYIRDLMKALFKFGEGFSDRENDQELLARYLSENKSLMGREVIIDEHSDLFLTLYGGHRFWIGRNEYKFSEHRKEMELDKDGGALHYLPTDSWPCVMHFPANGNADELLEQLGYKLPTSVDKNYTQLSHAKYLFRMTKFYSRFLYTILLKLVIIVALVIFVGYLFFAWRNARKSTTAAVGVSSATPDLARRHIQYVPYQPWPSNASVNELPRAFLISQLPPQLNPSVPTTSANPQPHLFSQTTVIH